MYLTLFGLLCMCFVSFGRTDMLSGGRFLAREHSEENADMEALFSMMDTQTVKDNQITFDELKQAWLQQDTDGNEILSDDEVKAVLGKANVKYNAEAKFLFSDLELTERGLQQWFDILDLNRDEALTKSEFKKTYHEIHEIFSK